MTRPHSVARRTVSRNLHRIAIPVLAASMVTGLSACFGFGPPLAERAAKIAAALESSEVGVLLADVAPPASFTGSLSVTVTLDEDVLHHSAISAEDLDRILEIVGRGGRDLRVGSAVYSAYDSEGREVSLSNAAEELGLGDNVSGDFMTLNGSQLEKLAAP
ncbi:hypothetical protein [Microbacterium sp. SORGH_AS_0421]|uniref:hypothetical protein n=1 Tax=Microbacterium sp. SORGH_AS_0421 TaxID=3041768 RepID=UPI002790D137|nr:hypothetical protein [Microbacterium sp. SORGH_AS_0421]MDQ1177949.1 ribosomal protein S12 methylthiotransferase accessory factor YcaO [Microbacterium sp. SORGH_AS_0421]